MDQPVCIKDLLDKAPLGKPNQKEQILDISGRFGQGVFQEYPQTEPVHIQGWYGLTHHGQELDREKADGSTKPEISGDGRPMMSIRVTSQPGELRNWDWAEAASASRTKMVTWNPWVPAKRFQARSRE
ncbi:hypothetical protein Bca52824_070554 [Brassica carinata]|uniref:Uncharacterized protein n=1 Tax=Brassica carinata TaxID=52824 RepID=A0A8X7U282_BRACI|nr:hypothetical protein Bca52824_070554 [Brassica carinata]